MDIYKDLKEKPFQSANLAPNRTTKCILIILCCFVLAILLECTLFNIRYYTTLGLPEITGYEVETTKEETRTKIRISNINQVIRTININPAFLDCYTKRTDNLSIFWQDEDSFRSLHNIRLINNYERSYVIPLGAHGNVEYIIIEYNNTQITIDDVTLNQPIPFDFRTIRVILLSLVFLLCYYWKKLDFSKIQFNSLSKRQKLMDAFVVLLFICFLFLTVLLSKDFGFIPGNDNELKWPVELNQSNRDMVNAIMNRQLHLPIDVDESLLNASRPYDTNYRSTHGIKALFDHVFFEGKYYSYFGIVPVLILFLPFHIITGNYLDSGISLFIFAAIATLGLYSLYRELVKRYLSKIPYTYYLMGMICLFCSSNLVYLAARPTQYETSIASGLMFSVWGISFVLQGVKPKGLNPLLLFFGALCLALSVGCRPTMVFCSLLVPAIILPYFINNRPVKDLFKDSNSRKNICISLLAVAIPYILVAIGLMWYNYQRFGSVFEVGMSYQITIHNVLVNNDVGILGNIRKAQTGLVAYLLTPFTISGGSFPFIFPGHSSTHVGHPGSSFTGQYFHMFNVGIFALPVAWFLFGIPVVRKTSAGKKSLLLISTMLITGFILVLFCSIIVAVVGRYRTDFFWLFIIPALLCMMFIYQYLLKNKEVAATFRRIGFVAMGFSSYIMIAIGIMGESNLIQNNNPYVFQYIADLFAFW